MIFVNWLRRLNIETESSAFHTIYMVFREWILPIGTRQASGAFHYFIK